MAVDLRVLHGLPIVCMDVVFLGRHLRLENVLLDTGSAGTILDADKVAEIGAMDYGIEIDGILGFDFIRTAGLIIDTNKMQVFAIS